MACPFLGLVAVEISADVSSLGCRLDIVLSSVRGVLSLGNSFPSDVTLMDLDVPFEDAIRIHSLPLVPLGFVMFFACIAC